MEPIRSLQGATTSQGDSNSTITTTTTTTTTSNTSGDPGLCEQMAGSGMNTGDARTSTTSCTGASGNSSASPMKEESSVSISSSSTSTPKANGDISGTMNTGDGDSERVSMLQDGQPEEKSKPDDTCRMEISPSLSAQGGTSGASKKRDIKSIWMDIPSLLLSSNTGANTTTSPENTNKSKRLKVHPEKTKGAKSEPTSPTMNPTYDFRNDLPKKTYSTLIKESQGLNSGTSGVWGAILNTTTSGLTYCNGHTVTVGPEHSDVIIDAKQLGGYSSSLNCVWFRISSYVSNSSQAIIESYHPGLVFVNSTSTQLLSVNKPTLINSMSEILVHGSNSSTRLVYFSSQDMPTPPQGIIVNNTINNAINSKFLNVIQDVDNNGRPIVSTPTYPNLINSASLSFDPYTSPYFAPSSGSSGGQYTNYLKTYNMVSAQQPPIVNMSTSVPNIPYSYPEMSIPIINPVPIINTNVATTATILSPLPKDKTPIFDEKVLEELIKKSLIHFDDLEYDLNSFPYYISDEYKELIMNIGNFFLNCSEFTKYSNELASLKNRILIDSPHGSDTFQKTLVRSIAKQFNSHLLVIDNNFFNSSNFKFSKVTKENKENKETQNDGKDEIQKEANKEETNKEAENKEEKEKEKEKEDKDKENKEDNTQTISLPTTTDSTNTIPTTPTIHASLQTKKLKKSNIYTDNACYDSCTSSCFSFIPTLNTSLDDLEYKPHIYNTHIKNSLNAARKVFKVGDKVKFHTLGGLSFGESRKLSFPPNGLKGIVVIPNEKSNNKVGVRFEKSFLGSNTLNNLLPDNNGYFSNSYDLAMDENDIESSLNRFIFSNLSKFIIEFGQPILLYITEVEKTISFSYERYCIFKDELLKSIENLPVLVISSIVINDSKTSPVATALNAFIAKRNEGLSNIPNPLSLFGSALPGVAPYPTSPQRVGINEYSSYSRVLENFTEIKKLVALANGSFDGSTDSSNLMLLNSIVAGQVTAASDSFSIPLSLKVLKILFKVFQCRISFQPPKDKKLLAEWTKKLQNDMETQKLVVNKRALQKIFVKNNIEMNEGETPEMLNILKRQTFTSSQLDSITGWALAHTFKKKNIQPENGVVVELVNEKLVLPSQSMEFAMKMWSKLDVDNKQKFDLKNIELENEYEKKLLSDVIAPGEIEINFENIGALTKIKETLIELIMLPLQRPELFNRGNLTRPAKGILLFGPPGTGKTMLAKALACESGAHFLSISVSSITSKWFGEGEKFAKSVFTLASKLSPCIIFIDEVDAVLSKRDSREHDAMRKIKNEMMAQFDGLKTKENERVVVLAATNRPFDLDEAVLRRFNRKLLVDLPDEENRLKILKIILEKEELSPDFDMKAVAAATKGFTGSDLKNLSISAAYSPIREFMTLEKENKLNNAKNELPTKLRAITNQDFTKALKEISPSVSEDSASINDLRQWNEMYGESEGHKKPTVPSYFM